LLYLRILTPAIDSPKKSPKSTVVFVDSSLVKISINPTNFGATYVPTGKPYGE
jgi:hypothetical protein